MARRGSPLKEAGAWLLGLVLPLGGLATALALTLTGEPSPSSPPTTQSTTLVAGANTSQRSAVAPTATPRDSIGGPLLTSPISPAAPAPQPVTEPRPDVAGVQLQSAPPSQSQSARVTERLVAPLIGQAGGYAVPAALPASALLMTLAGFAWRVHTSAPWPSKNARQRRLIASPRMRSARA